MPPMLAETAMAMGVVRDLGAMERATAWLPPSSRTMAVAADESDKCSGEECRDHGPEATAHVFECTNHGDSQSYGRGAEKEVDELGAGEVVLIGEVEKTEGDADDHDRNENGIGQWVTQALLDLDAKQISAKGEDDGEERHDARRESMRQGDPVHRPSSSIEARRPKRCMIQAVVTRVIKVLPRRATEMGKPGGTEQREIGDDAHACGDEEKTEPAEKAIGGLLECGDGSRRRRM